MYTSWHVHTVLTDTRTAGREVHLQEGPGRLLCIGRGYPGGYIASSQVPGEDSSPRYAGFVGPWEETHRLVVSLLPVPAPAVCAVLPVFGRSWVNPGLILG